MPQRLSLAAARSLLGVTVSATAAEIKRRYRLLAKRSHPDVGGDAERFKEINEAHALLINTRHINTRHAPRTEDDVARDGVAQDAPVPEDVVHDEPAASEDVVHDDEPTPPDEPTPDEPPRDESIEPEAPEQTPAPWHAPAPDWLASDAAAFWQPVSPSPWRAWFPGRRR